MNWLKSLPRPGSCSKSWLLCLAGRRLFRPKRGRLFLWLLTGYATAIATYAIHAKLRLILHDFCAPFVEADVDMMHRLGEGRRRISTVMSASYWS